MKKNHLKQQDPIKVLTWYLTIALHIVCASGVLLLVKGVVSALLW
jgi:hypothetical protein